MAPSIATVIITFTTSKTEPELTLFGYTFRRVSSNTFNYTATTDNNFNFSIKYDGTDISRIEIISGNNQFNISCIDNCFDNLSNMTVFSLSNNVIFNTPSKNIFYNCTSLTNINMPGVTQINESWFSGCTSLTYISLPSVITIGPFAFSRCTSFTNISLPSVTTIGSNAFQSCVNLSYLYISSSIISLPSNIFSQIPSDTTIYIDTDNITPIFTQFALLQSVTVINRQNIYSLKIKYHTNASSNLSDINTTFGTTSSNSFFLITTTNTNDTAYYFSQTPITIPSSNYNNSTIPNKGNIKSIIISGLITNISTGAFSACSALISIEAPLVTTIENNAFIDCTQLTNISLPSVITIGSYAFSRCTSLTNILSTNISLPSVTRISDYGFSGCTSLTSFTIPNTIATMGQYVFSNCSLLTTIIFPASSTTYTVIGNNTFSNCNGLTSIIIPNYITQICTTDEGHSFSSCVNLQTVTFESQSSLTSIGRSAFDSCLKLQNITLPNSITSIGIGAFLNCIQLQNITLPNSITSIATAVFYNCNELQTITLPNSITSIGDSAFENCFKLQTISLPNSITSIGQKAFAVCRRLSQLTILQTVTSINPTFINYVDGIIIYTDNLLGPIKSIIDTINNNMSVYFLTKTVKLLLIGTTNEIQYKNKYNAFKNGAVLKWYYAYWK